jgi:hypothetical protein
MAASRFGVVRRRGNAYSTSAALSGQRKLGPAIAVMIAASNFSATSWSRFRNTNTEALMDAISSVSTGWSNGRVVAHLVSFSTASRSFMISLNVISKSFSS